MRISDESPKPSPAKMVATFAGSVLPAALTVSLLKIDIHHNPWALGCIYWATLTASFWFETKSIRNEMVWPGIPGTAILAALAIWNPG